MISFISYSTDSSLDRVLDTSAILKPCLASYLQYSAPIPSDAPVTRAQEFFPYLSNKFYYFLSKCFLVNFATAYTIKVICINPKVNPITQIMCSNLQSVF